jgi:hypothetical protein
LHTYKRVERPGTPLVRYIVVDVESHIKVRKDGREEVTPVEVWSTGYVHYAYRNGVLKAERDAWEMCRQLNGGRPRRASFPESLVLLAQLKAENAEFVRLRNDRTLLSLGVSS